MRRQLPLIVSCTSTFLLLAYSTIVTVAMPVIATDLHVGFTALQWVIDVYTIALAALLIPLGVVSDRIGRRGLLVWSLVVFSGASLICALAPSVSVLIGARLVQGIAAAAMFATTLPLLEASYSGRARHRAFAIWGAVSGLAAACGNVSGGLLSVLGWRTVFAAGIPLALAAAVLAVISLPVRGPGGRTRLNVPGMILLTGSISTLVIATLIFADQGPGPNTLLVFAVSVGSGILFVIVEQRHPDTALIGAHLVRNRNVVVATVVAISYYFAAFGTLPAIAAWLTGPLALDSVETSLVLSVQPVVFFAISALFGTRLGRADRRFTFTAGLIFCGVGCLSFVVPTQYHGWIAVLPAMILTGIGSGIISPVLPAAAMEGVRTSRTGVSSSAVNAARQLGVSLGIAACATIIRVHHPGLDGSSWSHTLTAMAALTAAVCASAVVVVLVRLRRKQSPLS